MFVCVHKLMHGYHVDALSNAERVDRSKRLCALYCLHVSRVEFNHVVQGNVNIRRSLAFYHMYQSNDVRTPLHIMRFSSKYMLIYTPKMVRGSHLVEPGTMSPRFPNQGT